MFSFLRIAALMLVAVPVLGGCAELYEPKPHISDIRGGTVISNTAALRNTYLHNPDDKIIVCAEPSPDSTFSQEQSGNLTIALVNSSGSDSAGEEEGTGEAEMTGRVPSVLLSRELLFRLCEFSRNHHIDTDTALQLYRENLQIIHDVSKAVADRTTIKFSDSVSSQASSALQESATGAANMTTQATTKVTADFTDSEMEDICGDSDYEESDRCKAWKAK